MKPILLGACLALPLAGTALAQGVTSTTNGKVQAGTAAKSGAISPAQTKDATSAPAQGQGGTMTGAGMTDGKGKGADGKR